MKRDRPNILWICTDQQRIDTLGCYGNTFVRTPHLDQLAQEGVLFENAFSQSPVCTPSRASFLTGRYPRTTRDRQNGQSIPADEILITKFLADVGYVCGLSGKLHLSVCHPRAGNEMEPRISDGYQAFHWSHHPAPDWKKNEYIQWLEERRVSYRTPDHPLSPYIQVGMPEEYHQTTWCVEKAIAFIQERAESAAPWLFSVNLFDPHHPFDPPAAYLDPYLERLDEIPLPDYLLGELDNKPGFQQMDHQAAYNTPGLYPYAQMTDRDHRLVRAAYWAMCDLIDHQVGRLLEALNKTGQREDTLVIFMSDHGEMLGDHGIYLKGPYFYDPAIHVPLIFSWPGQLPAGQRIPGMVELTDIAPTLLDLIGLAPLAGMQGRSMVKILRGEADSTLFREDVYCEYYNAMPWHQQPQAHATMLRTGRYKLVAVHGQARGELYDLETDPGEHSNLWEDPAYQAVKLGLFQRLCDRMAWTVDPLPLREAAW